MVNKIQRQQGFTLIEILIVVILIGILATTIIPSVLDSTEEAKLNTLQTNLSRMRKAIDLYWSQHDSIFPGANDKSGKPVEVGKEIDAEEAFVLQLTQYTDIYGKAKTIANKKEDLGPYIKSATLPINPFNELNTVKCDIISTDITTRSSDGSTGWKFYTQTGILIANDGDHNGL